MLKFNALCHWEPIMLSHYQNLVRKTRPIVISRSDSEKGPRIGGTPPEGIVPPRIHSGTRYFATLPLDLVGTHEVTLFTTVDHEAQSEQRNVYQNVRKVFELQDFVQIVVHP